VQAARFQRPEDKRKDLRQRTSGYVQQARARPNGVINLKSIKLIKAHHADRSAKTFLGFSGNIRRLTEIHNFLPPSGTKCCVSDALPQTSS